MRARNHALDGLRGLAALGVLTLHVWMFTVQGAHGRDELVSLLTGELRLGVVLFFVLSGYLLAGPWVASALDERPAPRLGRFAVKRAARIVPAYWVAMLGSFWLLAGTGHDYEVSAGQLPLFAAFGQNYVGVRRGQARPADVVARGRGELLRGAPARRVAARARARRGRMVLACAGLAGLGLAWSAAGVAAGLARDGDGHAADLPARLRLRHGRRGAGPPPRPVARVVVGARRRRRRPRVRRRAGGITRAPA